MSILALDVGGTHLRSAWVEESELVDDLCIRVDLSSLCAKAVERAEVQLVDILLSHIRDRLDQRPANAVALGMPGFINCEGVIVSSPNLPGIQNFALHQSLQTAIGLPVVVANDALCAVQGAWLLENPRPRSLAILTLGTGVGGGLVLDGQPVLGTTAQRWKLGISWRCRMVLCVAAENAVVWNSTLRLRHSRTWMRRWVAQDGVPND